MDEIRNVQLHDIYRPLRCTGDDCPQSCAECKKMAMVALSVLPLSESEGHDATLLDFGFTQGLEFGMAHSVAKKSELSKIWVEARSQAIAMRSSEKALCSQVLGIATRYLNRERPERNQADDGLRAIVALLASSPAPTTTLEIAWRDINSKEHRIAPAPSNKGAPDGPTD